VESDSNGHVVFAGVPCGDYTLAPLSARGRAAFDVTPTAVPLHIVGPTNAGTFTVARFAAAGHVTDHSGRSLQGVVVSVNGVVRATSDANGYE